MFAVLTSWFSLVCGHYLPHTWMLGGEYLPCCQRCTGLYTGAALAALLHVCLRPQPSRRFLAIHGLFIAFMAPLGFHLVPQDAFLRCLSGLLFGSAVVAYLWLAPGSSLPARPLRHLRPRANLAYWLGLILGLSGVLILTTMDSYPVAVGLSLLAFLGAGALAVLAAVNLVAGIQGLAAGWTRRFWPAKV